MKRLSVLILGLIIALHGYTQIDTVDRSKIIGDWEVIDVKTVTPYPEKYKSEVDSIFLLMKQTRFYFISQKYVFRDSLDESRGQAMVKSSLEGLTIDTCIVTLR